MEDLFSNSTWIASSVYGPSDGRVCANFWSEWDSIGNRWRDPWCMGDVVVLLHLIWEFFLCTCIFP